MYWEWPDPKRNPEAWDILPDGTLYRYDEPSGAFRLFWEDYVADGVIPGNALREKPSYRVAILEIQAMRFRDFLKTLDIGEPGPATSE